MSKFTPSNRDEIREELARRAAPREFPDPYRDARVEAAVEQLAKAILDRLKAGAADKAPKDDDKLPA